MGQVKIKPASEIAQEAQEATKNTLVNAIQKHLDDKAKERNYDNIMSLCTYATSANPKFKAEGQAGVEWRDQVWAKSYDMLDQVMTGKREIPTVDELIAELPVFVWPDSGSV